MIDESNNLNYIYSSLYVADLLLENVLYIIHDREVYYSCIRATDKATGTITLGFMYSADNPPLYWDLMLTSTNINLLLLDTQNSNRVDICKNTFEYLLIKYKQFDTFNLYFLLFEIVLCGYKSKTRLWFVLVFIK